MNLKPEPDGLNLALRKLGISNDDSIFVGDSLDDVNAAKSAGLKIVIISKGENAPEDILAAQPDYLIHGYEELLPMVPLP